MIYIYSFLGSEVIWRNATKNKPETFEQFCGNNSFQDGDSSNSSKFTTERGLSCQFGSERCIFQHSNSSPTSELPEIYLKFKEPEVRVSRPSFRTNICSKNIHKMHEASYVSSEVSSPSGNYLHRRFSVDGKQCTDSGGNRFIGSEHILTSRFSNQRDEILPSNDSINHVLGLRDRYSTDDSFFTTRESLSNFQRNSKFTSSGTTQTSFCTTCHTCRSCCSCCLPMSFVWKETKRSIASSSNILRENDNIFRTNYGIKMVDSKYAISQLEACIVSRSGYDYNNICFKNRLGDERTPSVRQMVIEGHSVPYQFPGIKSSLISTDDFGQSSLWPKYSNSFK